MTKTKKQAPKTQKTKTHAPARHAPAKSRTAARAPPKKSAPREPAVKKDAPTAKASLRHETAIVHDDGPSLNDDLLGDIRHAEEQAHAAVLTVANDADRAQSLSDAASHPKITNMVTGEALTLDYLCRIASAGNTPTARASTEEPPWPTLCDGDGRVTVKRGRAQRKVPARDLEAWFRGDPKVLKSRQAALPNDSTETMMVGEGKGAKHYVRKRKTHDFESDEGYTVSMTEGQLAKFRGEMAAGKRLLVLDKKMRTKKEIDEYPGDQQRRDAMRDLLGIILASTDKDGEERGEA